MHRAVLRVRSADDAIVQDRLEPVEVATSQIGVAVDDDSGQSLSGTLAHDARLARVNCKAFLQRDGGHLHVKPPRRSLQLPAAGEGQVVGGWACRARGRSMSCS